jgi:hypothetical protein
VRRGVLRPDPPPVFLPVRTIAEPSNGKETKHVVPPPVAGAEQVSDGKIEIRLPDGTAISVGQDVSLLALRRVETALRR